MRGAAGGLMNWLVLEGGWPGTVYGVSWKKGGGVGFVCSGGVFCCSVVGVGVGRGAAAAAAVILGLRVVIGESSGWRFGVCR